jgi:hypothetical protein
MPALTLGEGGGGGGGLRKRGKEWGVRWEGGQVGGKGGEGEAVGREVQRRQVGCRGQEDKGEERDTNMGRGAAMTNVCRKKAPNEAKDAADIFTSNTISLPTAHAVYNKQSRVTISMEQSV